MGIPVPTEWPTKKATTMASNKATTASSGRYRRVGWTACLACCWLSISTNDAPGMALNGPSRLAPLSITPTDEIRNSKFKLVSDLEKTIQSYMKRTLDGRDRGIDEVARWTNSCVPCGALDLRRPARMELVALAKFDCDRHDRASNRQE
ncbi:hypothetical protein AC1031_005720 [Aphanomyces cochlioides]|nr:hypothetical protein AC1031_005720 [Aphanomyces cochlioides]